MTRGKNFPKKFARTCSQTIVSFVSKTSAKTFSKKQLRATSEKLNLSGETIGRKTSEGLSLRCSSFIRLMHVKPVDKDRSVPGE